MSLRKALKKISADKVLILLFCGLLGFLGIMNADMSLAASGAVLAKIKGEGSVDVKQEIQYFSTTFQEYFYGKYSFINANGLAHRMMGQREMNEVYKLGNGFLAAAVVPPMDPSAYAEAVISLYHELSLRNIDLLYMQAPYKIDPDQDLLPPGVYDYANQNVDGLLKAIESANVPTLDLRMRIRQEGMDFFSMFYRTDLHWTTQAGFWAFQKAAKELNERFGYEIDQHTSDGGQYQIETFKNIFLGSAGKRTGAYYAGVDDFSLLKPLFATDLSVEVPQAGISVRGSFEDVFFHRENLRCGFLTNPYFAYMGTSYQKIIKNHLPSNGKKVMIVKDSFAEVVIPYFAVAFQQVDAVDLRFAHSKSLLEQIDAVQPDLVVFLYNPGGYVGSDNLLFQFFQPTGQ